MSANQITYLIRTESIDTDDRLNKTRAFLEQTGARVEVCAIVKRFVPIGRDACMHQRRLVLRRVFPSGRLVTLKYIELLLRAGLFMLLRPGQRWYANFDFLPLHCFSVMLLRRNRKPIWDLHEMPPLFMAKYASLRRLITFLLRRSRVIVCNEARRQALETLFNVDLGDALVLRNLPDKASVSKLHAARRAALSASWAVTDHLRIVFMGGIVPGRYGSESVDAIAALRKELLLELDIHVIGGLGWTGPESFVHSTGRLSFRELLERSVMGGISLCFYGMNTINNRLCEPNRFFQAVMAGQHVITFDHPSLRDVGYPWHHVIDEMDFSASLSRCLRVIIESENDPQARLAWAQTQSAAHLVFERQYPRFAEWLARA